MTKQSAKIRGRRTNAEIENALWSALEKLIIEKGFHNITLVGLAKAAGIEPPVIYNRFRDLDDVFDKYIRKYDYWLNDSVVIDKNKTPKENCKTMMVNLVIELYDNEIMQKILIWVLASNKESTYRVSRIREMQSADLTEYFSYELRNAKMDFKPVSALLISGIYYLILHRKISTFATIDFSKEEGKQILISTVEKMIDIVFAEKEAVSERMQIAKRLLQKGIDKNIIMETTDISLKELNCLENN